jgi:hypothetical protein
MLSGRLDDGFIEDHDYEPQFDEQSEELEA